MLPGLGVQFADLSKYGVRMYTSWADASAKVLAPGICTVVLGLGWF